MPATFFGLFAGVEGPFFECLFFEVFTFSEVEVGDGSGGGDGDRDRDGDRDIAVDLEAAS